MSPRQLLVLAAVIYTVSAFDIRRLEELIRAVDELDVHGREAEKKDIWQVTELTHNSALVQLQRTSPQKQENGYWMLQYRSTSANVQPVQWTNAWTGDFKRWNNLRATMTTSDGEIKSISGGFVQLSGLHAATEYDLRTAYSTHPDGRDSVIEPSSGERLFTTKAAPGNEDLLKRLLDLLEQ